MKTSIKVALAAPVVAGVVGGLGLGSILNATPAHADVHGDLNDHNAYAYAASLADSGAYVTGPEARAVALAVCSQRAAGVSEWTLRHHLEQQFSIDLSVVTVDDAEFHFCPAYETDPQTGGPAWPQYTGGADA